MPTKPAGTGPIGTGPIGTGPIGPTAAGGGTNFQQSVTANVTGAFDGGLKDVGKLVTPLANAAFGSITKAVAFAVSIGTTAAVTAIKAVTYTLAAISILASVGLTAAVGFAVTAAIAASMSMTRAVGKIVTANATAAASVLKAVAFAVLANVTAAATVTRGVVQDVLIVTAAACTCEVTKAVGFARNMSVSVFNAFFGAFVTSTQILNKPINYVLAKEGVQRFKHRFIEYDVRAKNETHTIKTTRSGVTRLGGKTGFTTKTDKKGY
jgi:hypothetical protein